MLYRLALVATDAVMLFAAVLLAGVIKYGHMLPDVFFGSGDRHMTYYEASLLLVVLWLVAIRWQHLYDLGRLGWGSGEFTRLLSALTVGSAGLVLLVYTIKVPSLSRGWTLMAWLFALAFVTVGRLAMRYVVRALRWKGKLMHPTLIVGANQEAADLVQAVRRNRSSGLAPVAYAAGPHDPSTELHDLPCIGNVNDLPALVREAEVDTVLFASTAFPHRALTEMVSSLNGTGVNVRISSGLLDVLTSRVMVNEVSGVPIIIVEGRGLTKSSAVAKRALDIVVSGSLLLVISPILLAVALAIKLTSAGPVLYRQERVGTAGKPFTMLKFRSMYVDAHERRGRLADENEASGPLFKMKNDPRITPVGRVLRKFSIDEFPQLVNVLLGQMSLVGPRPALPEEVAEYEAHHARRLDAVPGMTGLWQVSGRSDLSFEEMVRLDLFYIRNWSLRLDLALLLRTIPAVVFARGSY